MVGKILDDSRTESLVVDGGSKAVSLGSRIFRVSAISGLGPEGAEGTAPFVASGVACMDARMEVFPFFLELGPGGG